GQRLHILTQLPLHLATQERSRVEDVVAPHQLPELGDARSHVVLRPRHDVAHRGAVLDDHVGRVDQSHVRSRGAHSRLTLQGVGPEQVVIGRQDADQLAPRLVQALVVAGDVAPSARVRDATDAMIVEVTAQHRAGLVRGRVVDHYRLPLGEGLGEQTVQRLCQKAAVVVARDDERHARAAHATSSMSGRLTRWRISQPTSATDTVRRASDAATYTPAPASTGTAMNTSLSAITTAAMTSPAARQRRAQ